MNYYLVLAALVISFVLLLLLAVRIGKHLGRNIPEKNRPGASAIEGLVFALLGLLVAFMFSGAAQRMSDRRDLIVQEVNDVGTAWLRIDMLNAGDQPQLRDQFRSYVDARIDYNRYLLNAKDREVFTNRIAALQKEIWATSIKAAHNSVPPFAVAYIDAVNDMFDISTSQTVAQKLHPPVVTYIFLCFLALVAACLVGVNLALSKRTAWLHQVVFAVVTTAAIYIIIDFEFPRVGIIRIDQSDALLVAQRQAMVEPAEAIQPGQ